MEKQFRTTLNTMGIHEGVHAVAKAMNKAYEGFLLEQLGDLVKAGHLVVKPMDTAIFRSPEDGGFTVGQMVRFELKDQEFIDSLKQENEQLKAQLESIKNAISGKENK